MPAATNSQVQAYVDQRVRPRCEQIRDLLNAIIDDKAVIDDVYTNLNNNPTWDDTRVDNPPHLLVLGWNALITDLKNLLEAHGQLPIVLKACVHPVG